MDAAIREVSEHLKAKRLPACRKALEKARKLGPNDTRVLHLHGLYEFEMRNAVQAEKLVRAAMARRPKDPAIKHNLSAILISLGKFDEATALLKAAIAAKPDYAEAYHTLSPIYTFAPGDPLIDHMERGIRQPGLSKTDLSFYGFALAKAQDDAGDPERAWVALEKGNAAMAGAWNGKAEREGVALLEQTITRERLEGGGHWGHPTTAPILVVGMPRSGTTLLETVIAEHPQVLGAGEVPAFGSITRQMAENLKVKDNLPGHARLIAATSAPHIYGGGLGYLNFVRQKGIGWFDHFVDKLPDNSFHLGLVSMMLPRARVVHIMRHPLDIMLSIYFQRFTAVRYAFRPKDIVAHYRNYRDVMALWRRILPLPLVELRYENLVQDRDFAQRLLWEKLDLTTEVAHVPARPGQAPLQTTASRWQVRQPVYQSSREKFRKYETQMQAFIGLMGGMEAIEAEVAEQDSRCILKAAATA